MPSGEWILRGAIDAIWQVHGEQMLVAIAEEPERWPLDVLVDLPDDDLPLDLSEDDIPF